MHTQRTVHEDIVHETKEHTRLVIYIFGPGKNSVSQSKMEFPLLSDILHHLIMY